MAKRPRFTPCVFLPYRDREQAPKGARVYDVSSYAEHPFDYSWGPREGRRFAPEIERKTE